MNNTPEIKSLSSICANCGKEGSNVTNSCNKCKIKYCNASCKKKHRHKHKIECEQRVAELHDEKLFKQPPTLDDCPICFLRLPLLNSGRVYMSCCGKILCRGCTHAFQSRAYEAGREKEDNICPFCRARPPNSNEEKIKQYRKRSELNDTQAIGNLGCLYSQGQGIRQNHAKALELFHRAADLGYAEAYSSIGHAYQNGRGVEVDEKKARHYWELAAMGGSTEARYNLGIFEGESGNYDQALKHWMIAVKDGDSDSVQNIKILYSNGLTSKDEYAKALRSYQAYVNEVKSDQRDQAAAYNARYRYYESSV